jgi:hypothetical protein
MKLISKLLKHQLIKVIQAMKIQIQQQQKKRMKIGGTGALVFNRILQTRFCTMKIKIAMHLKQVHKINQNH